MVQRAIPFPSSLRTPTLRRALQHTMATWPDIKIGGVTVPPMAIGASITFIITDIHPLSWPPVVARIGRWPADHQEPGLGEIRGLGSIKIPI